jgi:hypothetical protein
MWLQLLQRVEQQWTKFTAGTFIIQNLNDLVNNGIKDYNPKFKRFG